MIDASVFDAEQWLPVPNNLEHHPELSRYIRIWQNNGTVRHVQEWWPRVLLSRNVPPAYRN